MVEAVLILPLVAWLVLAALQLVWIFWAQQLLANTSHYVLRAGQLHHGDMAMMRQVLATGMAATQVNTSGAALNAEESVREHVWRATAQALLHSRLAAQIRILTPTAQQTQTYSERRYDLRLQQWVQEIAIDHVAARLHETQDADAWLAARQLQLEIWWCFPLEVPWVSGVLQQSRRWRNHPAQQFCQLREAAVGKPLWPLIVQRQGPMQSGYRGN